MRTLEKGDDLRATVAAESLPVEIRRLDVSDSASVAEGVGDPTGVDVVVNNAGFEVTGALELVDDELWSRQLDTNVLGPMRVIRAVLPAWRERGSGTIVNVSSIAGVVGSPFGGAYSASKHALEGLIHPRWPVTFCREIHRRSSNATSSCFSVVVVLVFDG